MEYYALTKVNKMQPLKHSDTDDCRTGVGGRIRGTKYLCHPCNSHEVPKEGRTGRCAEGGIVDKIISKSMKCLSQNQGDGDLGKEGEGHSYGQHTKDPGALARGRGVYHVTLNPFLGGI